MKFDNDRPAVTLSRSELEALVMCAHKDAACINLHTIHIDPAFRSVVASTAAFLLVGTEVGYDDEEIGAETALPSAPGTAVCISITDALTWMRLARAKDDITVEWAEGTVTARINNQLLTTKTRDVKFPPWRSVFPAAPEKVEAIPSVRMLGARLVQTVLGALCKVTRHDPEHVGFAWYATGSGKICPTPVLLTASGDDSQWRCVLMPMSFEMENGYAEGINPWRSAFPEPEDPKDITPHTPKTARVKPKKVAKKPAKREGK